LFSLIQSLTMASNSAHFFMSGTTKQFDFVLSKYQDALQAKADSKNSKSEVLLKLDKWYQNELPKKIKSRGKEAHLTHEEIVQLIKWKLARGKFRPRLKDLIQMNTPRVVMQETKKAFRAIDKRKDIEAAVSALSNLKGVGPAMASAVLAAMAPDLAPFMADELLLSMPEVEGIDYTMKEYMKLVEKTKECVDRLNAQGGDWNPHKVEMAVWTYYILREHKPEILEDLPEANETGNKRVTVATEENGVNAVNGEVSNGETDTAVDNGDNNTNTCNGDDKSPAPESIPTSDTESSSETNVTNGKETGENPETPAEPVIPAKPVTDSIPESETPKPEAPVENGKNGVSHEGEAETVTPPATEAPVKRPLDSDTENGTEENKSEPECKRVCSDNGTEEMGKAAETTPEVVSEAPNGVNNTPQPITSGGD